MVGSVTQLVLRMFAKDVLNPGFVSNPREVDVGEAESKIILDYIANLRCRLHNLPSKKNLGRALSVDCWKNCGGVQTLTQHHWECEFIHVGKCFVTPCNIGHEHGLQPNNLIFGYKLLDVCTKILAQKFQQTRFSCPSYKEI